MKYVDALNQRKRCFDSVTGSPYLINVGGQASGRVTESIVRQQQAGSVKTAGSTCELNITMAGKCSPKFLFFLCCLSIWFGTLFCSAPVITGISLQIIIYHVFI